MPVADSYRQPDDNTNPNGNTDDVTDAMQRRRIAGNGSGGCGIAGSDTGLERCIAGMSERKHDAERRDIYGGRGSRKRFGGICKLQRIAHVPAGSGGIVDRPRRIADPLVVRGDGNDIDGSEHMCGKCERSVDRKHIYVCGHGSGKLVDDGSDEPGTDEQ
jgi:hypothetical protein